MDYKKLIEELKGFTYWLGQSGPESHDIHPPVCDKAVAAIETLLAERDAAIKDARDFAHHPCKICIHWKFGSCSRPGPKDCAGFNWWKWRGLQKGDAQ